MKNSITPFFERKTRKLLSSLKLPGLLLLLSVAFLSNSSAQIHMQIIENSNTKNFAEIVKQVEEYYKTHDKGKGSGYKQFKRWEEFNRSRLDKDGNIQNITQKYLDEMEKYNRINSGKSQRLAADFSGNWVSLGPVSHNPAANRVGNGRVNRITVDPLNSNIIYAGTPAGGLWRSTDAGANWTPLTDGIPSLGISGIAIDPSSPASNRTIYILTGDGDGWDTRSVGVLKSIDNGSTWQSTGLSSITQGFKLMMHPTNSQILFAGTQNGLFKTINGGASWSFHVSGSIRDIKFKPGSPDIMYATRGDDFLRSADGGISWTQVTAGLPAFGGRFAIAVSPASPDFIYLIDGRTVQAGQFGGVFRSVDSGLSFTLRSDTPNILTYDPEGQGEKDQAWYDLAIAVNPTNAYEIHVGGINTWKSTNGGITWTLTSKWYCTDGCPGDYNHADIHSLDFYGNGLYCGSDGGVSISTNNGDDWTTLFSGLVNTQIYRISVDATNLNKIMYGAQDNGTNLLESSTYRRVEDGDGMQCLIDPINTNILYSMRQDGDLSVSFDNGYTRTFIEPDTLGDWITPYAVTSYSTQTLYAGYRDVWKTKNRGMTWTNISNGMLDGTGSFCNQIALAPSDASRVYVSKGSTLYKTTNDGATWTKINGTSPTNLPFYFITDIEVSPTNAEEVWVTLGNTEVGRKVYLTKNGGTTWKNISGALPNFSINCIVYKNTGEEKGVYLGTDIGVYFLEDGDSTWVPFNMGLPNVIVRDLEIKANRLFAGTYGRGVWSSELDPCLTEPLVLLGTHSGYAVFETSSSITSEAEILNGSSIRYIAGTKLTIYPGFKVNGSESYFKGNISSLCGSTFKSSPNVVTGFYTGPMESLPETESSFTAVSKEAKVSLINIFPNPFESTTSIQFTVPQDGLVSLEIADMMGTKSEKLIDKTYYKAGTHQILYEGYNLIPGMYSCILRLSDKTDSVLFIINR